MNPNHLTPNVRRQVVETIEKLCEIKKAENSNFKKTGRAFETEEEFTNFFKQYYEKIKNEVDNEFGAFMELCSLEDRHGFVGAYLGGADINPDGDTIVRIG